METMDIDKQAIILLTAYFKNQNQNEVIPLSPVEWKLFTEWLKERGYTPGNLLEDGGINLIQSWKDNKISGERLMLLLKRGAQMGMALEKWSRAGIWILTRSDPDYPKMLKSRLGAISPPILFGTGNKELLNIKGIAVVGSRDISDEDINFSKVLGKTIHDNSYIVISGGAKGVDESAMLGSLENNGSAVGVLADSLLRKSLSQIYRQYLSLGNLVLISPYYPEAGFNVGNAMGRNKYIYCLSEFAIVVHSGLKGGTWTGANENLKKNWVPLYVKESADNNSGNLFLINNGGKVYTDKVFRSLKSLGKDSEQSLVAEPIEPLTLISKEDKLKNTESKIELSVNSSFYQFFISRLFAAFQNREFILKDLQETMDIKPSQIKEWLIRGVKDKIIVKLSKPVRYKLSMSEEKQITLFN